MAFNPAPSSWIPSFSEDGTNIAIPLASFPLTNATEADGTTGDIRKVLYAVCEKLSQKWTSLDPADRPAKMQIGKSQALNATTGQIVTNYQLTFILQPADLDVAAE